jgi:hypothetical protein
MDRLEYDGSLFGFQLWQAEWHLLENLGEWDVLRVLQLLLVGALLFEFSFRDGDFALAELRELLFHACLGSIVFIKQGQMKHAALSDLAENLCGQAA